MKNTLLKIFAMVLMSGIFYTCNEPLLEEQTMDEVELKSVQTGKTSYIVVLNDPELNAELANLKGYEKRQQAAQKAAEKVIKRAGVTDGELGFVYGTALKGFSVKIPPGQLKKLENDPAVKTIIEDQIISLGNPEFKIAGDIVPGEYIPYGITRVNGGFNYTGNNVAWIIDTGIDTDHPDLNVDVSKGVSFVEGNSSPEDDQGHGTHVAGTVAAKNTGSGLVGVAAGATVVPVKVLGADGSGAYSWIIAGVDFVAEHGQAGDVANMSLGGPKYDPLNEAVINAASSGIKFSLAAGNERTDANTKSPASANHANIYTVSACDINDIWARFSNYGNPPVDYCAPGVDITSTYIGGEYATASGTSMAAPHVAGILLLGDITGDGFVSRDRDRNPDPIAYYSEGETPANNPPVANAGDNITVIDSDNNGSETVTLDGTESWDPDNDFLTYSWVYENNVISTAESFNHTFQIGEHTVNLTVSDGIATSSDNVVVTVNSGSTSNIAPVINTFDLTNTSNPAMKRVQVSWSVSDSDGDLKTVETQLTGPGTASAITNVSGFSASGVHELSVKKGSSGLYTVKIIATDIAGNSVADYQNITL